eukprot:scaffold36973_cov33-Tisochrysis_lutea.AAC.1
MFGVQGGSRTSGPGFRAYLDKEAQHWHTMFHEFVVDTKRAKASMAIYRGKRSTQDRAASSLLKSCCKVGDLRWS